jgi:hypothetical protein
VTVQYLHRVKNILVITELTITVSADETERSLNPNNFLSACAITLQFFSVCNFMSLDAYYKFSLT